MFRAHVLIIRRSKLHYTASGIITPMSVMILETVGEGESIRNTLNKFMSVINQLDVQVV